MTSPRKPLVLNELLVPTMNSWGNVQYGIPLRISSNETRTGTSVAHRFIPAVPYALECKVNTPLPEKVSGRDMVVSKETYRTTSSAYCVKPNLNKAAERADCAINCRRVGFMTGVEKRLLNKNIIQPVQVSETRDVFRGLPRPTCAPEQPPIEAPDPYYIFDVVASGRNEAPVIPENIGRGVRKELDPYFTTYRKYFRPFTPDEQLSSKDHVTIYTETNTPKVKGFGPKYKEIWMPLTAHMHRSVYDRIYVKKEYKEVATGHNVVDNIKGVMVSETKKKFLNPFVVSSLATWSHGETFDNPPFDPNPYQTNMSPFMYCSDYCHIAQGTPPYTVIDQLGRHLPPHKTCSPGLVVSEGY